MSKKRRAELSYTLEELEGLDYSSLLEKFDIMTNADAFDSEAEGCANSDAEDGFPLRTHPQRLLTETRSTTSSSDEGTPNIWPASSGVSTPIADASDEEIDDEPVAPTIFQNVEDEGDIHWEDEDVGSLTNLNWTKTGAQNIKKNFAQRKFEQPFGAQVPIDLHEIKNIFFLFFNLEFARWIVNQSELYASQMGHQFKFSIQELNAFLGILIIMGINQLPSMKLYWSTNEQFRNRRIVEVMSQKRFLLILRMLHLNDNRKMPQIGDQKFDKLYKLRPMIDHFSKNFKEIFKPSRYLSVDESMIPFKGRSSFKQYVPMKPIKRGFKIFAMCCSVTGYMISFNFYTGKDPNKKEKEPLGERIIFLLTKGFENMGYILYFDRFFSSIVTALKLLQKGLYVCATIMQDRKLFPKLNLKADKELGFGESDFAISDKGTVGISKWKDKGKKTVCVISTKDDPSQSVEISRRTKTGEKVKVMCPQPISEYNKYMGGVDKFDQYMAYYSIQWKSRRWWVKGFYYFTDAAIVNSYILYRESMKNNGMKPLSHLKFRSHLADELIGGWMSKKVILPKVLITKKKFGPRIEKLVSKSEGHLPVKGTMRRCALCSTKKKPKRSNLQCKECNVALCKTPCFNDFHEQMSSKQK